MHLATICLNFLSVTFSYFFKHVFIVALFYCFCFLFFMLNIASNTCCWDFNSYTFLLRKMYFLPVGTLMLKRPRFCFKLGFCDFFPLILKSGTYSYVMFLSPSCMVFWGSNGKNRVSAIISAFWLSQKTSVFPTLGNPKILHLVSASQQQLPLKSSIVFLCAFADQKLSKDKDVLLYKYLDTFYTMPLYSGLSSINHSCFCSTPNL